MENNKHDHEWWIWKIGYENITDRFIILYTCGNEKYPNCDAQRFNHEDAGDI